MRRQPWRRTRRSRKRRRRPQTPPARHGRQLMSAATTTAAAASAAAAAAGPGRRLQAGLVLCGVLTPAVHAVLQVGEAQLRADVEAILSAMPGTDLPSVTAKPILKKLGEHESRPRSRAACTVHAAASLAGCLAGWRNGMAGSLIIPSAASSRVLLWTARHAADTACLCHPALPCLQRPSTASASRPARSKCATSRR